MDFTLPYSPVQNYYRNQRRRTHFILDVLFNWMGYFTTKNNSRLISLFVQIVSGVSALITGISVLLNYDNDGRTFL